MKKYFILLLFVGIYTPAFSQEYIGLTKESIIDKVTKIGVILRSEREAADWDGKPAHHLLFKFPKDSISKRGVFMMLFFLSDKGCYNYTVSYIDDKFKKPIIDSLNKEFHLRAGNEEVWENKKEKTVVQISNYMQRGKITTQFYVVVKKT